MKRVDHLLKAHAPDLFKGVKDAGISEASVQMILEELSQSYKTRHLAAAIEVLRRRLRNLAKKTEGEVFLPAPAAVIKREPSPYPGDAIRHASLLAVLEEAFYDDIKSFPSKPARQRAMPDNIRSEAVSLALGRILFSAAVNGGLLEKTLLWRLPEELVRQPEACDDLAWITFALAEDKDDSLEAEVGRKPPVRRWIIDYVTLGLIQRLLAKLTKSEREGLGSYSGPRVLREYLTKLYNQLGVPTEQRLKVAQHGRKGQSFLQAAEIRIRYSTPPVVVRFLLSLNAGESMSEKSWWRCLFDRHYKEKQQDVAAEEDLQRVSPETTLDTSRSVMTSMEGVRQQQMLTLLKIAFKRHKPDIKLASSEAHGNIVKILEEHESRMAPLVRCIFWWFEFLLSSTSRPGNPIRTVSAETYRSRIVKPMIDTNWEFDVSTHNPEVWEEFYADVLAGIGAPVQRKHATTTIRMLHRFLMAKIGAPPVMLAGELEEGSRCRNVLISEADFQTLRDYLRSGADNPYMRKLIEVIAILIYRAGLRPNDIVALRFRNISGCSLADIKKKTVYPVLYCRTTTTVDLKTSAAVRQVPLPWFLPAEELKVVTQFLYERLTQLQANGMNLSHSVVFAEDWGVDGAMKSSQTFGLLSQLLKEITRDPDVSSYHLRHSFISTWIHKLLTDGVDDPDHPMLRPGCRPRELIYALSTIAAHDGPEITTGTYCKTMDMVAHHYMQKRLVDLPARVRAGLESVRLESFYQRRRPRKKAMVVH
ncbi:MAG: hypothetical protein V2J20_08500 [Wenzhouxiangella sp.]|nr:hypothetical protein [Wenzhouxiangella sp.]